MIAVPTVSSDLRPRNERPVTLSVSHPADQSTIDAAHAAYLRSLREREGARAELSHVVEHTSGGDLARADERRTDAVYDLAETAEALLSALGYGLPAEPATDDDACPHCADEDEDEDDTEGCPCGMADRGAPGHDDHHDAERARVRAELLAVGLPPSRRPAHRAMWNQHTNDLGDHCPHSGEETDEDPDDDAAACPAGCRSSYPTTDED